MRRSTLILVALIAASAIGVRVYRFGSMPAGMHQDEISAAYDAYSILHYGVDRHGLSYPVVLTSWGSSMNALPAYVEVPFLAIGGATAVAVRSAQLLGCLGSIVLFALLARRLRGPRFGLLALFLIAIAPWHILISRWALDENLFPVVFLAGVFFQVLAAERPFFLPVAYLFFGLSLYAHGAAYFTVPAYVALTSSYALASGERRLRPFVVACVLFIAIATPIALYLLVNMRHLESIRTGWLSIPRLTGVPRYETVSSVFQHPVDAVMPNAKQLVVFLLRQGDANSFSAVPGYGLIYMWAMPIAAIGIVAAVRRLRRRADQPEALMLVWLAVGLMLGALVAANVNRMNILLFPLVYFSAAGVEALATRRPVLLALLGAYALSFAAFTRTYFITYGDQIAPAFFVSFDRAIAAAASPTSGTVCVTNDRMNMPYVYVLFHQQIDPRVFARTVVYENPGAEFQGVLSFDRYVFGLQHCPVDRAQALVARSDERLPAGVGAGADWRLESIGAFTVAIRSPR